MLSLEQRKLFKILEISSIVVGVIMTLYYFYPVFASPPSTPYAPGETTDPSCSPGDTNCTVYPPLTTTLTTSTAIIMGTSSLRFAYNSTNYTSFTVASDGGLTIASTNSATTTFSNKISFASLSVQGTGGTNPFIVNSSTGSSLFTILQNGNVGIGSSTPAYKLAVSGTVYAADIIAKGGVFVDVRAYGATNDGSTDSTAAIQAAVNAAYLNLGNAVGGVVYIPAGIYTITGTITVSNHRVHIIGAGKNATYINFNPSSGGLPAFHFNGGASVLYQNSISNISINGSGSLQKIGIQLTDTSEMLVEDVSMLYMNGDSSIGIKLRGREMTTLNRITLSADRPIVISDNPNHTIDVDHLHVQDAYLIASGTNPNVTIDSGINLSNVVFDGTQAWVLGGHGLQWIDTSTVATSQNLTIKNVRWEQSTNANGYLVDIEHNYTLQNLIMENLYGGLSTNGIKLRNINWATLENFMYVDTAKTAFDVNTTTRPLVLKNVFFQTGSTSTFGGLTTIMDTGRSTQGGTTYAMAVYDIPSATSVTTFNRIGIGTSTPIAFLSVLASSTNGNNSILEIASSSGASVLRILANGRVGIGTSTPRSMLQVEGTSTLDWQTQGDGGNSTGLVTIGTGGTGGSLWVNTPSLNGLYHSGLGVAGTYNTPANRSVINLNAYGVKSAGGFGSDFAFSVTREGILNEAMRIDMNGRVGIGTTTPIATLSVLASSTNGNNPIFEVASSSGTSFLRVLANGNVGIGTVIPSTTLEVAGGAITLAYQQGINSRYSTGASASILKVDTGALGLLNGVVNTTIVGAINGLELGANGVAIDIRTEGTLPGISFSTASTERLRLQNDGRWGFNSSSPKSQFTFQALASSSPLFDIASSSGDSFFRVLANGNVGIGTSTPSTVLSLIGNSNTVGALRVTANNSTDAPWIEFGVNGLDSSFVNFGSITNSEGFRFKSQNNVSMIAGVGYAFKVLNPTATTEYLTVVANTGKVGINSSSPIDTLSVQGGLQVVGGVTSTNLYISGISNFGNTTFTNVTTTNLNVSSLANILKLGINSSSPIAQLAVQGTGTANPFSVNSSTGSVLLNILTNGNVGIGTSTPSNPLVIQSDTAQLKLATNSGPDAYNTTLSAIYNSAHPFALTVTNAGNAVENIGIYADNGGGNRRITLLNANVAINTTTNVGTKFIIQGDGTTNPFSIVSSTAAATSMFTVLTNGRVGINTSSPTSLLGIQGTGITSTTQSLGIYNASSSLSLGVLDDSSAIIDGGAVYHDGTGKVTYINSLETGNFSFPDDAGSVTWTNLNASSSAIGTVQSYTASIGDNPMLTVYGESDGSGGIKSTSTMIGFGTSTPQYFVDIWTTSSPQGLFRIATTTNLGILTVRANGNVGIGTVTPGTKLDVTGGIWTSAAGSGRDATYDLAGGVVAIGSSLYSYGYICSGNSLGTCAGTGGVVIGTANPLATVSIPNTGTAFFNGGKVGVGTSTPLSKLFVQGSGTENPFSIVSSTAAASSMFTVLTNGRIGINSSSPNASLALQGTGGTNPFSINSSTGDSLFSILQNGNVGIGAATPIAKLHFVSANDFATNDIIFSYNAAGDYRNGIINTLSSVTAAANRMIFTVGDMTATGQTNVMTLAGNGRVGINSSTPLAVLSVLASSTNGGNIIFEVASSSGTSFLRVLANGNVGIGTSTPSARLEVWGTGNTSSTLALNTFSASGTSTFKIDNAGNASFANDGFYYEASSSVSYINSFETGGLNFDDNAGLVSWIDMNVSSTVVGTPNSYTASIGGNPMIQVYGDSNGSGGVTNMTVSIGTSTTSTYKMYIDAGVSTTAGLGVNGYIKATGFIAGTSTLDIAETYPVDPECDANGNCPQIGDVVCSAEDTSSTFFIEQCAVASADKIIGVVSGNPGFILGGYDVKDTKIKGLYPTSFRPIALAGRVPVSVSTANGAIKAGDYLTSSAIPGVAVKAVEPGKVIGMALQSFDGSLAATGTVTVFVNTSWSPGSPVILSEAEESLFPDFTKVVLDKFTLAVKNSLRKLGLLIKDGVAIVKEVFADKVTTQQLCVGNTCVNESQLQEILNKTQTQAAPVNTPVTSPPVIPSEAVADEGSLSTTTPAVIPTEVEGSLSPTNTLDVTIPVEPVIVNTETASTSP